MNFLDCDNSDNCKGALMGWFHKKCVKELKWRSIKSVIDPKFKFTCKECLEYQNKIQNENIMSIISDRIVDANSNHNSVEDGEADDILNNQIIKREEIISEFSEQIANE